jgi:hypothetical protein
MLLADGRPTPATTFLLVHRALRRDLVLLRAAARTAAEPDAGQVGWVRQRWQLFRAILDDHHAAEDRRLFPALRAAEPALAPVLDELDAQHAGLDAVLDRAEDAVDGLPGTAGRAVVALGELASVLVPHLALEEEHLVPVMLRAPLGPPPGDGARPDDAVRRWVGEGLDEDVLAALAHR